MKKIVRLLLMVMVMCSMVITSFAASGLGEENVCEKELYEMIEKYDLILLSDSKNATSFDGDMLYFEDLQQLEDFIISLEENSDEFTEINEYIVEVPYIEEDGMIQTYANHERHMKEWRPYSNGTFFAWEHVFTNFDYKTENGYPVFTEINSVDSDITGVNFAFSYEHKTHTQNFSNSNRTVAIKARGRSLFGVSIAGFEIGVPYTKYIEDKFTLSY